MWASGLLARFIHTSVDAWGESLVAATIGLEATKRRSKTLASEGRFRRKLNSSVVGFKSKTLLLSPVQREIRGDVVCHPLLGRNSTLNGA